MVPFSIILVGEFCVTIYSHDYIRHLRIITLFYKILASPPHTIKVPDGWFSVRDFTYYYSQEFSSES